MILIGMLEGEPTHFLIRYDTVYHGNIDSSEPKESDSSSQLRSLHGSLLYVADSSGHL